MKTKNIKNPKNNLEDVHLVVTTYSMIARYETFKEVLWNIIVLDEAQAIKNVSTKQSRAIKNLKSKALQPKKTAPNTEQIYFSDLAAELSRQLGTKVKINKRGRSGKVEIEFYSNDDLDRLIDLLKRSV